MVEFIASVHDQRDVRLGNPLTNQVPETAKRADALRCKWPSAAFVGLISDGC